MSSLRAASTTVLGPNSEDIDLSDPHDFFSFNQGLFSNDEDIHDELV